MARNEGATISNKIDKLRPQATLDLAKTIAQANAAFLEQISNTPENAATLVADLDARVRDLLRQHLVPAIKATPNE